MKKLSVILAFFVGLGITAFYGCSSQQVTQDVTKINADLAKIPTPAQVANQICPPVQAALTVLSVPGVLDPKLGAELAVATPIIDGVCTASATVNVNDLHSLASTALPAVLQVVQVSTLSPQAKQDATIGIAAAQSALAQVIAANTTPAPAAAVQTVPAAPATPGVTPAAPVPAATAAAPANS